MEKMRIVDNLDEEMDRILELAEKIPDDIKEIPGYLQENLNSIKFRLSKKEINRIQQLSQKNGC